MEEDPLSHCLHLCYRRMREEEGRRSVYDLIRLPPHTVIYEHHFPKHWLYYEGNKLFRKTGKDITDSGQIYKAYTEGTSKHDDTSVVAVFVTYAREIMEGLLLEQRRTFETAGGARNLSESVRETLQAVSEEGFADETFSAHYLTKPDLLLFLRERRNRTDHGVLFKFIKPRSEHTEAIKVHWSPHLSTAVHRVNQNRYFDHLGDDDVYLRHDAFKNNLGFVRQHNAPPLLADKSVAVCNKMMADVEAATGARMIHGTFFFQPGAGGALYFLFCNYASLRKGVDARPTPVLNPHASFLPSNPNVDALDGILESFQTAPLIDRYNFFLHHLMPKLKEASGSDREILSSKEEYMMSRFFTLAKEVRKKESRARHHAQHVIQHRSEGAEHKQSMTLAKLAQNLYSKMKDGESTAELEILVRLVAGSQHSCVAAAVAVAAVACYDLNPLGPRRMQSVQMYRAKKLRQATEKTRRAEQRELCDSPRSTAARASQVTELQTHESSAAEYEARRRSRRGTTRTQAIDLDDIPVVAEEGEHDDAPDTPVARPQGGATRAIGGGGGGARSKHVKIVVAPPKARGDGGARLTFTAPPSHAPLLQDRTRKVTSMHSSELQRTRPGVAATKGQEVLRIHIHSTQQQKMDVERRAMRRGVVASDTQQEPSE